MGYLETRPQALCTSGLIMIDDSRLCFVVQGEKGDTGLAGISGWPGLIVSQLVCSLNVHLSVLCNS